MIAFITGTIEEKSENGVVINCNGMGYEVQTSTATLSSLPLVGEECKIYTYLQVKEDGISLFGFTTVDERELFYKLISVSGVGPKMAITVTSPDSSWENPNNSYATLVTRRISSRASSAYFNLYPLE